MNISLTRQEINVLWAEICMVVDAADECIEAGSPRADDAILRSLKDKLGKAHTDAALTPEARRIVRACENVQRQLREAAGEPQRRSKWDRFQEVQP